MIRIFFSIFLLSCLLCYGCTGGLDPTKAPTVARISGTVTFVGGPDAWPAADSVLDIRIAAFKEYPPTNVIGYTDQRLKYKVQSQSYSLEITEFPVNIRYIAVEQQFGSDISKDWRIIGVFTRSGDVTMPSEITINEGQLFNNIDIIVNFSNLPPNPFQ